MGSAPPRRLGLKMGFGYFLNQSKPGLQKPFERNVQVAGEIAVTFGGDQPSRYRDPQASGTNPTDSHMPAGQTARRSLVVPEGFRSPGWILSRWSTTRALGTVPP